MTISPCSYNYIQTYIHMQVSRLLFLKNGVIYIRVYISLFLLFNMLWKSLQVHSYSSYPLSLSFWCLHNVSWYSCICTLNLFCHSLLMGINLLKKTCRWGQHGDKYPCRYIVMYWSLISTLSFWWRGIAQ